MNWAQKILACFLLSVLAMSYTKGKGFLSKCMLRHESRVLVTCPADHVIYNLELRTGRSIDGTCTYQDGDCVGQTRSLSKQKKKCQWNRRCNIKWQSGEKFVEVDVKKNGTKECFDALPNYISIGIPQCIHSESIIDICSDAKEINFQKGIIRSPKYAFSSHNRQTTSCMKHILASEQTEVWISMDKLDVGDNGLKIWNVQTNGSRSSIAVEGLVQVVVRGRLEIVFNMTSIKNKNDGFSLSFSRSTTQSSHGSSDNSIKSSLSLEDLSVGIPTLYKSKSASLQECMTAKRKQSTMSCEQGEVIYNPQISAVVSKSGSCRTFTESCEGMTPDIMVQKFRCFWKKSCDLIFRSNWPIASSDSPQCIGHLASFSSVKRQTCIREDYVYDICKDENLAISGNMGLIRSHESYPWNYDAKAIKCRRHFELEDNQSLTITADDTDLDPEGSDVIKIFHTYNGRREDVFNSSLSTDPNLSLRGGKVEVLFMVAKHTKSGRGFVLVFKRQTVPVQTEGKNKFSRPNMKRRKRKNSKNRKRLQSSTRNGMKRKHRKRRRNRNDVTL